MSAEDAAVAGSDFDAGTLGAGRSGVDAGSSHGAGDAVVQRATETMEAAEATLTGAADATLDLSSVTDPRAEASVPAAALTSVAGQAHRSEPFRDGRGNAGGSCARRQERGSLSRPRQSAWRGDQGTGGGGNKPGSREQPTQHGGEFVHRNKHLTTLQDSLDFQQVLPEMPNLSMPRSIFERGRPGRQETWGPQSE